MPNPQSQGQVEAKWPVVKLGRLRVFEGAPDHPFVLGPDEESQYDAETYLPQSAVTAIRAEERERVKAALAVVPSEIADAFGQGVDIDTAAEDEIDRVFAALDEESTK